MQELKTLKLPGVIFRPMYFETSFQKHTGQLCGGAQIYVTDRKRFKPFKTGVAIIKAVHKLNPELFTWKRPPYEYEKHKLPIDILTGTDKLRRYIEKDASLELMEEWWKEESRKFQINLRKRYLMYK
jgi:uncharacterized protein YbbC (DUF1343 family)